MRTEAEIISERFRLSRGPATRQQLWDELNDPMPIDEVFGSNQDVLDRLTGLQTIITNTLADPMPAVGAAAELFTAHRARFNDRCALVFNTNYGPVPNWRQLEQGKDLINFSGIDREYRKDLLSMYVPHGKDFWNPLMHYAQDGDRPLVALLMLCEMNRAPTSEARVNGTYCFWTRGMMQHTLSPYSEWCESVELNEQQYQLFLNAADNRLIPGVAREQNFPREAGIEILGAGPGIIASDELLNALSSLYAGLKNGELMPAWQEPGPFNITIGDLSTTINQTPGTLGAMQEYIQWKAMHPKTAEYQIWRLLWPILGANLTPRLHAHLINVWLANNGSVRAVLQAMVMHDDAYLPARNACSYRWARYAAFMNKNNLPHTTTLQAFNWKTICGIELERAADAKGTERNDEQAGASFTQKISSTWPGTVLMGELATGADFLFV